MRNRKILNVLVVVMLLSAIVGCANASNKMNYPEIRYSNEEYLEIKEEEYIRNLSALIENVTDKMFFSGLYRSLMDISKEIQKSICKKQG